MAPRVLLVHGAATTAAVWDAVIRLLCDPSAGGISDLEVLAPERPSSGDLAREVAFLAEAARGAVVVGVSGGATLGLALASGDTPLAGAVLHEPAVGTLVPGLLDHVVAGYAQGGVEGFGRALYGPGWSPEMAPDDPGAVARDLAMFRAFQPAAMTAGQGNVVVTVGGDSAPARHEAARVLRERLGVETRVLPGCRHFVQHDDPAELVRVVIDVLTASQNPTR
jgi:pimeloyl-ACP methyl ester carboxylesterase